MTARHTVAINPAAVSEILGPGHDLGDARMYLRDALSANSLQTLECAGQHRLAGRRGVKLCQAAGA